MTPLRVAIAGAGGIGRHHAKWHAYVGSEVVAALGQRPEQLPITRGQLQELFGFHGRMYSDFGDLLRTERPDVVDICAPNDAHYDLARQALAAGCHVLCEKPLVWGPSPERSLALAADLHDRANSGGLHLGMCSQYAASLKQYGRICSSADPVNSSSFVAEMETLSRGQPRGAAEIWVDMGPHPLSLILAVWPTATLLPKSLHVRFIDRTAEARFTIDSEGHRCDCRVKVRDCDEGPLTRRFAFDGHSVDLAGRASDDGTYRSVMISEGLEDLDDDFMLLLIEQFTRVVSGEDLSSLVPSHVALRNLEFQASILASI
jgi:hypothetical protein